MDACLYRVCQWWAGHRWTARWACRQESSCRTAGSWPSPPSAAGCCSRDPPSSPRTPACWYSRRQCSWSPSEEPAAAKQPTTVPEVAPPSVAVSAPASAAMAVLALAFQALAVVGDPAAGTPANLTPPAVAVRTEAQAWVDRRPVGQAVAVASKSAPPPPFSGRTAMRWRAMQAQPPPASSWTALVSVSQPSSAASLCRTKSAQHSHGCMYTYARGSTLLSWVECDGLWCHLQGSLVPCR